MIATKLGIDISSKVDTDDLMEIQDDMEAEGSPEAAKPKDGALVPQAARPAPGSLTGAQLLKRAVGGGAAAPGAPGGVGAAAPTATGDEKKRL